MFSEGSKLDLNLSHRLWIWGDKPLLLILGREYLESRSQKGEVTHRKGQKIKYADEEINLGSRYDHSCLRLLLKSNRRGQSVIIFHKPP